MPGAATQLAKTNGDPGAWYFNNPLPAPLSVTARDANNCPVPGVAISWAIATGDGALSTAQSTTGAGGVATTNDSLGSTATQTVTATFTGLPTPVTFTAAAAAPPTSAAVTVNNDFFSPEAVVMQAGDTVTWTWNSAGVTHDVDYDGGPAPLPTGSGPKSSGVFRTKISAVGRYTYHCNFHTGMTGSVRVGH